MDHPYLKHYVRDERPWGFFERLTQSEESTIKIITVHQGEMFSLQTHALRDEYWRILSGDGIVTVGDTTTHARAGQEFYIPRGTVHRAQGGSADLVFLEVAFGQFDENDIVRLEDKYGRPDRPTAHISSH
ncbi:MAG TPA: phosphomannose isomerase type II C-terminal cupin domain [Candidatus Paceibacterota bacterium]